MKTILAITICILSISVGWAQEKVNGGLRALLASGEDPRMSRIFSDQKQLPIYTLPPAREVPLSTESRYVPLQRALAIVSPNIPLHPNRRITQTELSISSHPKNANIFIAGANAVDPGSRRGSIGWYISTDGGNSWYGGDTLPTHTNLERSLADPAVAIDLEGNMFINAVYFGDSSDVILARSSDYGNQWADTVIPHYSNHEDKNHCVIDCNPSSPFVGTIYSAFTDFDPTFITPAPIMFSRSTNGGRSFSTPVPISGTIGNLFAQGVNLAVGPNGELYATWSGYDDWPPPVRTRIGFNVSTDGGVTWQVARSLRTINDIRGSLYKGSGAIRVNSFPSMAVDRSNGSRRGWLYLVYAERAPRVQVSIIRSSDGGTSWSAPKRVHQDQSINDHWFPWASVDPVTGILYVVYYDSRNFRNNDSAQVYLSFSVDGGETFEDILVSDVAFLPKPIPGLVFGYMGDYIGVVANNGIALPAWNDDRTGIYQAYTSRIQIVHVGNPPTITVHPETLNFGTVYSGFPDTLTLRVRNIGFPDTLVISNVSSSRSDIIPEFSSFRLAGGENKLVRVVFAPDSAGSIFGHITIASNDTVNPIVQIPVLARVLYPPIASLSSFRILDTVIVGDSGLTKIRLNNYGQGELHFSLTSSAPWLQAWPDRGTVQPYEGVDIQIRYRTTNLLGGTYQSVVQISTNDPRNRRFLLNVNLRIVGKPRIVTSTDTISFGDVSVGYLERTTLTITNAGTDTLVITNMEVTDNQFMLSGAVRFRLVPLSSRDIYVNFLPVREGNIADALTISSNDNEMPLKIISLTGKGVTPPSVVVTPDSILFSLYRGDSSSTYLSLTNRGPGILRWRLVNDYETTPESEWLNVTSTEGTLIAGGAGTVLIKVSSVGLRVGTYSATITISCNDPLQPRISIPVRLTVMPLPNLRLSTYRLHFQNTFVGYADTLTVKMFNASNTTMTVYSITSDNANFQVANFSTISLASGMSFSLQVVYQPQDEVYEKGTLTIETSDPSSSRIKLEVSGKSVLPPVKAVQNTLPSIVTLFSGDTAKYTVTVRNSGVYDLHLHARSIPHRVDSANAITQPPEVTPNQDSIFLPYYLRDGLGYIWDIQEDGRIGNGTNNAFAGGLRLLEFPSRPTALIQESKRELIIGPASIGSVLIERRIYVPQDRGFIRYLEVISNPTNVLQRITLTIISNLGVDNEVQYTATSSGDSIFTVNDLWIVSDDTPNEDDPAVVHVLRGEGDVLHPVQVAGGNRRGLVSYMFRVNIPSGETRSILHYSAQRVKREDALSIAAELTSLDNLALEGLDAKEKQSIINFNAYPFLQVYPREAVIPAKNTQHLHVKYHTSSLTAGSFRASLLLQSNDPSMRSVELPTVLQVRNAPNISSDVSVVQFGNVFVGYPDTQSIRIRNTGSDTLHILHIYTDNSSFSYIGRTKFPIAPQAYRDLRLRFLPTEQRFLTSTLSIISNDPTDSLTILSLSGNGVSPPSLRTYPDSLVFEAKEYDSLRFSFQLYNNGTTPLQYRIHPKITGTEFTIRGSEPAPAAFVRIRGNIYNVVKSTTLHEFKTHLYLPSTKSLEFVVYEAKSLSDSFYLVFRTKDTVTEVGQRMYSSGLIGIRMKKGYFYYLAVGLPTMERFYIKPITSPVRTPFGYANFGAAFYAFPAPSIIPTIASAQHLYYQSITTSEYGFVPHVAPDTGVISQQDSVKIIITSPSLPGGKYQSRLAVESRNPKQTLVVLPARINVLPKEGLEPDELPAELIVFQNYPNPFNPLTNIQYLIRNKGDVTITVYNILGQKVDELLEGIKPAGRHTVQWNSESYASGVYWYTVKTVPLGGSGKYFIESRKMLLLR